MSPYTTLRFVFLAGIHNRTKYFRISEKLHTKIDKSTNVQTKTFCANTKKKQINNTLGSVEDQSGVQVHRTLKAAVQVDSVVKKAYSALAFINRGIEFRSREVLKSRKHLVNFPELFQTHRPRACFYSVLGMIRTDRAGLTKRELRSGMQCSADSAGTSHRDLAKVDRHKWSTQYGESRTLLKRAAAGDSSKFKSKFIMEMDKQPKCKRQRGGGRRRWRCDAARAAVPNDIICVN
ncbi:uncharacterized protein LOC134355783 isoform X2 [Mobula hypostoma]|uniref:uncharacterized protein LOC134355783 isoform X2 n=1 Tax=Mobula hypostoma TaxID=723540 RepID=UPI002FC33024